MFRRRLPDIRLRAQLAKRKHHTESKDQMLHFNIHKLQAANLVATASNCNDAHDAGDLHYETQTLSHRPVNAPG